MIINMSSGGAGALLINVVGGLTPPENPTYGTVWLETEVPINGWEILSVSPDWEAAEGHVYLQNIPAVSSEIPNFTVIDAAKKPYGSIWERIMCAKQMINGEWVRLNGAMWRDGVWTPFFAAILNVSYPVGTICTATDGVRTLESDVSGTFTFTVDNAGPWTVTSTYDTATITVGNDETIDLDLARYYLIRNGQVNMDRLGNMNRVGKTNSTGAVFSQTPWVSQGKDRITYGLNKSSSGWDAGIVHSSKKIDLKPFSELTIEGSHYCMPSGGDAQVRAWTSIGSHVDANAVFAFTPNRDDIMITSTPINIAKECFIGFSLWTNRAYPANIVIRNLYLK